MHGHLYQLDFACLACMCRLSAQSISKYMIIMRFKGGKGEKPDNPGRDQNEELGHERRGGTHSLGDPFPLFSFTPLVFFLY